MSLDNETSKSSRADGAQRVSDAGDSRIFGIVATLGAAWLALSVARKPATPLERKITPRKEDVPIPLRMAAHATSVLSYPVFYLPLAVFIARRLRAQGVETAAAVPRSALLAWLTYHALKTVTHRQRPPSQQGDANDDRSYPSGHATAAAAIAWSTACLMLRQDRSRWADVLPAATAIPFSVGASRIILGKHWPTDVLGGFATGAAVAAHTTAKYTRPASRHEMSNAT
jgi:membrane-associated phospholipid phosphatase